MKAKDAKSIREGIEDARYALVAGGRPLHYSDKPRSTYLYAKAYLHTIYHHYV